MILERLRVAGFRTFADPVEFVPDPRFTVIHAPNGTGKSTLLDALYYGLLERHTISGDGARQRFKSLGRDLTPEIAIDFAVDAEHYRLRKAFLSTAKMATLQRLERGRYVALADGTAADDFIRERCCAVPAGRGVIEPNKHLGFHHVLFSPSRARFSDVPESVGDQIRTMLGGSALAVTDGERGVQELVTKRFAHFFASEKNYKTAAGSANIPALEETLRRAREAELGARTEYARLDRLDVDLRDRQAEADRMSAIRDRLRAEIESIKAEVDAYVELKSAADRAARCESEARMPFEQISAAIGQIRSLRVERDDLAGQRAAAASELGRLSAAHVQVAERYRTARLVVEDAGAALDRVQQRAADVTAAEAWRSSGEAVERLSRIIGGYASAMRDSEAAGNALAQIVAPQRAELEALRSVAAGADTLRRTISASALSLEIDARAAATIEVITGERTGPLQLSPDTTTIVAAAQEFVVVDIPGFGRIRARGADGAAQARKQLRPLSAKLEAAAERYGTPSVSELAARIERVEELQRVRAQAETAAAGLIEGRPIDDIRESLAAARSRLDGIEAVHPDWLTEHPDAGALRSAFDRDLQAATDAWRSAQLECTAAEGPKHEIEAQLAAQRARDSMLAVRDDALADRLRLLESDGRDDAARAEHAHRLAISWNAARSELAAVSTALAAVTEDPRAALDRLRDTERAAGAAYEIALGEAKTTRAQLDMHANLGSYAKLAAAEEAVSRQESILTAARAQASAIACLSAAFDRVRAERVTSVLAPITAASTRYLTRIAGVSIGTIDIGSGLAPGGLIEATSGIKVGIDGTLSTGEQEQIFLSTRLALAEIISKDRGRQLFVVDDALTATDPNRLRRFIGLLEELSRERLQIIVTTSDRSRYLGVSGAKHFDLAAALLVQSAA